MGIILLDHAQRAPGPFALDPVNLPRTGLPQFNRLRRGDRRVEHLQRISRGLRQVVAERVPGVGIVHPEAGPEQVLGGRLGRRGRDETPQTVPASGDVLRIRPAHEKLGLRLPDALIHLRPSRENGRHEQLAHGQQWPGRPGIRAQNPGGVLRQPGIRLKAVRRVLGRRFRHRLDDRRQPRTRQQSGKETRLVEIGNAHAEPLRQGGCP